MLGLLGLFLVTAIVSLLGEALAPRGLPGGLAGQFVAGLLGAAQAAGLVCGLVYAGLCAFAPSEAERPEARALGDGLEARRTIAKRRL